jgi:lysozyme
MRTYSPELVDFVTGWEKCVLTCYKDGGGVWTVGWGSTGSDVNKIAASDNPTVTATWANDRLHSDLNKFSDGVNRLVKVALDQNQFDALVSFAYNVGLDEDADTKAEGLGDSTLLALVNTTQLSLVALQFPLWCHVNGHKSRGLERRRIAEMAMWRYGDYSGRP